jgi:hypothetical protein
MIRSELEKREKDINQLLTNEPDMMDVEEELRRLRKQLREPRDFTDTSLSVHEFQTMKSKMERSEMELVEKTRDLQELQLRLKVWRAEKGALASPTTIEFEPCSERD